jgi:hypothetical protein
MDCDTGTGPGEHASMLVAKTTKAVAENRGFISHPLVRVSRLAGFATTCRRMAFASITLPVSKM